MGGLGERGDAIGQLSPGSACVSVLTPLLGDIRGGERLTVKSDGTAAAEKTFTRLIVGKTGIIWVSELHC